MQERGAAAGGREADDDRICVERLGLREVLTGGREQHPDADAQAEQELREAAMEQDADELDAGEDGRLDRND
mgnify:CR=1 FL=1